VSSDSESEVLITLGTWHVRAFPLNSYSWSLSSLHTSTNHDGRAAWTCIVFAYVRSAPSLRKADAYQYRCNMSVWKERRSKLCYTQTILTSLRLSSTRLDCSRFLLVTHEIVCNKIKLQWFCASGNHKRSFNFKFIFAPTHFNIFFYEHYIAKSIMLP